MKLKPDQWDLVINALEYESRMEAGQSQKPDLIDKTETDQWKLAQELRRRKVLHDAAANLKARRAKAYQDDILTFSSRTGFTV